MWGLLAGAVESLELLLKSCGAATWKWKHGPPPEYAQHCGGGTFWDAELILLGRYMSHNMSIVTNLTRAILLHVPLRIAYSLWCKKNWISMHFASSTESIMFDMMHSSPYLIPITALKSHPLPRTRVCSLLRSSPSGFLEVSAK